MQNIVEKIKMLAKRTARVKGSSSWPPAVHKPFKTANRFDIIGWTLVKDNSSHLQFDHINSQPLRGQYAQLQTEMINEAMVSLNGDSQRFELTRVVQGYRRTDPTRGVEYRLTLDVYDHFLGKHSTKVFEVVKPITKFQMLPTRSYDQIRHVTVIVPVFGKDSHVTSLVENFSNLFKVDPRISLQLLLIYSAEEYKAYQMGETDVFRDIKSIITQEEAHAANGHMIKWKVTSSSKSMVELVADSVAGMSTGSIVFTSTSSTRLTNQFIERVRANVIEAKQIYVPMAFWQYDPHLITQNRNPSNMLDIARGNGHFGEKWFDHLAFFAPDFTRAKKSTDKKLNSVYDLLLTIPQMNAFRSPDADCLVEYQERSCSNDNIDDITKCKSQKQDNVGSGPILAMNLLKQATAATKLI